MEEEIFGRDDDFDDISDLDEPLLLEDEVDEAKPKSPKSASSSTAISPLDEDPLAGPALAKPGSAVSKPLKFKKKKRAADADEEEFNDEEKKGPRRAKCVASLHRWNELEDLFR